MKIILGITIFCLVLFIYLHLLYHLKTSDDLEVYTIDHPSKEKLEDICNLRQPVTFEYQLDDPNLERDKIKKKFGAFDIRVRDVKDSSNDYIFLAFDVSTNLFANDNESKYFTENNQDFLEESGLIKILKQNDAFLRPPLVSNISYDILYGSDNATTPFRYELNHRNFFYVNKGTVNIKLSPPKSGKYLYSKKDYENFEFRSPINPWDVQKQYQQDFNKIKCLDMLIHEGAILYIPAYWWYSIKFNTTTELISMKYKTYMNNIAILPELVMNLLQNQNVKIRSVENLVDTFNKNNDNIVPTKDVNVDVNVGTTDISDLKIDSDVDNTKILKNEKIENKKIKTT